jgi:hypothetical protein
LERPLARKKMGRENRDHGKQKSEAERRLRC